jgi:hypothetical protein
MLHAIQAPERVTPPAPARVRLAPVPTTPAVEGTATTPGTTPAPTAVAVPEDTGPTFREFFFNHPGIRCRFTLHGKSESEHKLTSSDRWNYCILHIPTYRIPTLGSPLLPLCAVWVLGPPNLQKCNEGYDRCFRSYVHLWN